MVRRLTDFEIEKLQKEYNFPNWQSPDLAGPIDPLTFKDPEGDTLLHYAALRGDEHAALMLLEAGSDPNAIGDIGRTPLHYASTAKHEGIVQLLLAHGAREDIRDEFGNLAGSR